jgi:DNA-binding transcriptional ArsR family regulator
MDLNPSLDPAFLSDLDGVPVSEVTPHVEVVAREGSPAALKTLTGVFLDRALHVLRDGSRRDLLEEALAVSRGISGEPGHLLRQRDAATYGAWVALDNLLGEAGRRSDRDAVPSILKNTHGLGLRVLEILAKDGIPVARSRIREKLELTESHLSHLLYNLEEADLVVRFRQGKEVQVKLGPVGQDLVKTAVYPAWVESLLGAMQRANRGEQLEVVALTDELVKAGAPSRLVAEKLTDVLARVASKVSSLGLVVILQQSLISTNRPPIGNPHARTAQDEHSGGRGGLGWARSVV